MRIGVFGNCQSNGMAQSICALAPDIDVFRFGLPQAQGCSVDEIAEIMEIFSDCDAVFIQPSIKHSINALSADNFAARCKRLVPYPLIASRVAHPDCHYVVDQNGKQVLTPLGPYHSAITVGAYLEGLGVDRALALFNRFTYRALGYDRIRDDDEVVAKEAKALGYDFSGFFTRSDRVYMHTINHPRIEIIFETARQGLAKLGVAYLRDAKLPEDNLKHSTVWPVYPGLFDRGSGNEDIVFLHAARNVAYTLPEFIEISYATYDAHDVPMNSAALKRVRAFINDYVVRDLIKGAFP